MHQHYFRAHSVLQHPPKACRRGSSEKSVSLLFTDIHSLYPGNGLSDGVIDFYKMLA